MNEGLQSVAANTLSAERNEGPESPVDASNAIIEIYGEVQTLEARRKVAQALLRKGAELSRCGLRREEIATCDDLCRRVALSDDPLLVEAAALAHNRRGRALIEINEIAEAFKAFDIAWATVTGWKQPRLARQAANALYASGALRWRQGQIREALSAWAELTSQFGDVDDVEVAARLAAAGEARITLLMSAERSSEAIRACSDVVTRFENRKHRVFVSIVGFALVSKAECLIEAGQFDDAMAACDNAIERMSDTRDPVIVRWAAKAAVIRGKALRALGRDRDAVMAFRDVNKRFRHHSNTRIVEQVASALINLADLLTTMGLPDKAGNFCDEVIRRYSARSESDLAAIVNQARYQRACAFAGMKDAGAALVALKEWVGQRGGLDAEAVGTDTGFDAVRDDPAFAAYVGQAMSA